MSEANARRPFDAKVEAMLATSLAAAREGIMGHADEKVFHIVDNVFLGTKFGAADRRLLDALEIRAVLNISAGSTRVPNYFDGSGIEYVHVELMDELISYAGYAIPEAYRAIRKWTQEGKTMLVHCSAGLSRSATAVIAWLMRDHDLSLKEAKELVELRRGRRPKCNPSFWCYLSALERELRAWPAGTPPSLDWTEMLVEDIEGMGISQKATRIVQALHQAADWVDFTSFYVALSGSGLKQLVQAQVVAQRANPDPKVATRAACFALEMLEVYHGWPALAAFALRVVQPLLCHPQERVRQQILSYGLVGKALQAMRISSDSADVQEAGSATLAYLANFSAELAAEVVLLGGVAQIVRGMKLHAGSEPVQTTGCIGLVILLSQTQCRRAVQECGGIPVVLDAMRTYADAPKVQNFCVHAIRELSAESRAAAELLHLGAPALVMRAAQKHPELRPMAADALGALDMEEASKPNADGAGGAEGSHAVASAQAHALRERLTGA